MQYSLQIHKGTIVTAFALLCHVAVCCVVLTISHSLNLHRHTIWCMSDKPSDGLSLLKIWMSFSKSYEKKSCKLHALGLILRLTKQLHRLLQYSTSTVLCLHHFWTLKCAIAISSPSKIQILTVRIAGTTYNEVHTGWRNA